MGQTHPIAHGTILALREIGRDTAGAGNDFLQRAATDGNGDRLAYPLIWELLFFAHRIQTEFTLEKILQYIRSVARKTLQIK